MAGSSRPGLTLVLAKDPSDRLWEWGPPAQKVPRSLYNLRQLCYGGGVAPLAAVLLGEAVPLPSDHLLPDLFQRVDSYCVRPLPFILSAHGARGLLQRGRQNI